MKNSELFAGLKPYIVELIRSTSLVAGAGTGTTGTGMQVHALDSSWHTGELDPSQATWALSSYRTVAAGAGLTGGGNLTADISLDVAAGDGIEVTGDAVHVKLKTTSGLALDANGLSMVTPATLTVASTSDLATHSHAITSSANPGAAASLLATTAAGLLTLVQLTATTKVRTPQIDTGSGYLSLMPFGSRVGVNTAAPDYALDVVGTIQGQTAVRSPSVVATTALTTPSIVTASGNLTITPVGYLAIDDVTTLRSATWTAGFLGTGWGISYPSAGLARLDIRQIYAEQLEVTAFVADTVRVNAGETWLGPGMGVTSLDFTMPAADSSTVRIYFEDNPAISGQLFTTGDYVLIQYVNRDGGGLTVTQYWGTVNTYIDGATNTQSWLFTLRAGATGTAMNIPKGTLVVGFGASGAGYIHNSVLTGGPFTRYGSWVTNPYTPANRTYHVQVGNLVNLVDYSSTPHYGLAAGKTLGVGVDTYSGLTVDETNGLRIFNASIALYNSGTQTVNIDQAGTMWLGPSNLDKRFVFDGTTLRIGGAGSTAWEIQAGSIVSSNVRIVSGNATNARIELGDGATSTNVQAAVAGVRGGDGTTLSGIAFWAGRPHAYRTSAPFQVTMGGSLTATDATLTGSFTAGNVTITSTNAMRIAVSASYDSSSAVNLTYNGAVFGGIGGLGTGVGTGILYLGCAGGIYLVSTAGVTLYDGTTLTTSGNITGGKFVASGATGALRVSTTDALTWTTAGVASTLNVTAPSLRAASGTVYLGIGSTNYFSVAAAKVTMTAPQFGDDWQNVPVENSTTVGNWVSGYQGRCKIAGDVVWMQGRFDPVNIVGTGETQIIATVSSEFHPAREQGGTVLAHIATGGYEVAPVIIATSGTITLSLSASWRSHDWVDFSFLQWSVA